MAKKTNEAKPKSGKKRTGTKVFRSHLSEQQERRVRMSRQRDRVGEERWSRTGA